VNVGGDVAEHAEVVRVVHDTADVVHLVAVQHLLSLPFVSQYKLICCLLGEAALIRKKIKFSSLWSSCNICAFRHIFGSPSLYMTLQLSILNFLKYEENFILFFISVV
jgi:hypothetical protein